MLPQPPAGITVSRHLNKQQTGASRQTTLQRRALSIFILNIVFSLFLKCSLFGRGE
jgi:hypothetical protein